MLTELKIKEGMMKQQIKQRLLIEKFKNKNNGHFGVEKNNN